MAVTKSTRRRVVVCADASGSGATAHFRERIPARLESIRFRRGIELGYDGITFCAAGQASGEGYGIIAVPDKRRTSGIGGSDSRRREPTAVRLRTC